VEYQRSSSELAESDAFGVLSLHRRGVFLRLGPNRTGGCLVGPWFMQESNVNSAADGATIPMSPAAAERKVGLRRRLLSTPIDWIRQELATITLVALVFIITPLIVSDQCIAPSYGHRSLELDYFNVGYDRRYYATDNTNNRTPLSKDEFFKRRKRTATNNITTYFTYDASRYHSEANYKLEPLWTCSLQERRRKLVFLHLSRSAGSTIRSILRAYASYCKAGIAFVSHCIDLAHDHTIRGDEQWINGKGSWAIGQNCWLTFLANRTGDTVVESRPHAFAPTVTRDLLLDQAVDILSGQLPLGSGQYWTTRDDASNGSDPPKSDTQYVVFFRRPLERFISEFLFRIPESDNISVDQAVLRITEMVACARSEGLYRDKYSSYFITPKQKSWVEREMIDWSAERRLNLTLRNLSKGRVMFGIVERLPESIEMLQYLLDRDNEIPSLSEYFTSEKHLNKIASQVSPNRTKAISQRIQKDASLSSMVDEYLKYEIKIYSFALECHKKQYSLWRQQYHHSAL